MSPSSAASFTASWLVHFQFFSLCASTCSALMSQQLFRSPCTHDSRPWNDSLRSGERSALHARSEGTLDTRAQYLRNVMWRDQAGSLWAMLIVRDPRQIITVVERHNPAAVEHLSAWRLVLAVICVDLAKARLVKFVWCATVGRRSYTSVRGSTSRPDPSPATGCLLAKRFECVGGMGHQGVLRAGQRTCERG